MKLRIELNKKEIDAIAAVKAVYSDFKTKVFDLPIVSEHQKGFHVSSWLNGNGYTYSLTMPSWVIEEYSRLMVKYHSRVVKLTNILNSMVELVNDWVVDLKREAIEIRNRHM